MLEYLYLCVDHELQKDPLFMNVCGPLSGEFFWGQIFNSCVYCLAVDKTHLPPSNIKNISYIFYYFID